MENSINIESLKELTIGEILILERQQKGVHEVIQGMKERVNFLNQEIKLKTGSFAEDMVNSLWVMNQNATSVQVRMSQ